MKRKYLMTALLVAMSLSLAGCSKSTEQSADVSVTKDNKGADDEKEEIDDSTVIGAEDSEYQSDLSDISELDNAELNELVDRSTPDDLVFDTVNDDRYGSYNGVNFQVANNSWQDTLEKDGWIFEPEWEDDSAGSVILINSKYGDDAFISLQDKDNDTVSKADIIDHGFTGYHVDFFMEGEGQLPNMTWNGVTFHATGDDIIAAYGEPVNTWEGDMYTSYTYNPLPNIDLIFYVYQNGGLLNIDFYVY